MALRKNIEIDGVCVLQTEFGNVKTGDKKISFLAYIKVENVSGSKTEVRASVNFSNDEISFSKTYDIPVSVEGSSPNFIKQAYEHLKKLPEFEGAVDC